MYCRIRDSDCRTAETLFTIDAQYAIAVPSPRGGRLLYGEIATAILDEGTDVRRSVASSRGRHEATSRTVGNNLADKKITTLSSS